MTNIDNLDNSKRYFVEVTDSLNNFKRQDDTGKIYLEGDYQYTDLEAAIKQLVLEARISEIGAIPLEHGNRTTVTYVNGEMQSAEERYEQLLKDRKSK